MQQHIANSSNSSKHPKRGSLLVITKAKDLCSYVFGVTEKSPKKFRASLVQRLQNLSLDIVTSLISANAINVSLASDKRAAVQARLSHQRDALVSIRVLSTVAQISREHGCILLKHYEQISKQLLEIENLLFAWSKSDRSRYGG